LGRPVGVSVAGAVRARVRTGATKAEPDPTDGDDFWAVVRDPPRPQAQAGAIDYLESCSTQAVAAVLGVTHGIAHAHVEAGRQTLGR